MICKSYRKVIKNIEIINKTGDIVNISLNFCVKSQDDCTKKLYLTFGN